ncbi:hypothetical protein Tco_1272387 [Tanacetum coccineum]
MACSLSHTIEEIKAIIYKQFEKDNVRQQAMMNWVVQFENASITKDDTRKAYEECNDIQQEKPISCAKGSKDRCVMRDAIASASRTRDARPKFQMRPIASDASITLWRSDAITSGCILKKLRITNSVAFFTSHHSDVQCARNDARNSKSKL